MIWCFILGHNWLCIRSWLDGWIVTRHEECIRCGKRRTTLSGASAECSITDRWVPRAFTLIELLVVVAIIALVVGLVLSTIAGIRNEARRSRCSSNERQIWLAVEDYIGTCRVYPGPGQIQLPDAAWICPAWWKDTDAEFQVGSYTWTFYHDRWGNPLTVGALDAAGLPARLSLTGDSQPRHGKRYQYVFLDGSVKMLSEQP